MKVLFVSNTPPAEAGGAHGFISTVKAALEKAEVPAHTFSFSNVVEKGHEFVWFLSPDGKFAQCTTPFAITVWDVAHRVHPYFPEVSLTGWKFDSREARYRDALPRASLVSIGTRVGAAQLEQFWGISPERILVNPLPVNPVFAAQGKIADPGILAKHNLLFSKYLLYPAQFWPHKNHITVLDALKHLPDDMKVVFTGHDMGNETYVRDYARQQGFDGRRVILAGFVSMPELIALYRNAYATIYASVMGPDNLPPIEAMACSCPVVSAAYDGAREQLRDGALFFPALNAKEAAAAVGLVAQNRSWLILRGLEIVAERTADRYVANIIKALDSLAKIRRLWGAEYIHL